MLKTHRIKVKSKVTVLKYAFNSLVATTADFFTFHLLVDGLTVETVSATFWGNVAGAVVSFSLLQHWVFKNTSEKKTRRRISKFTLGVAITMLSNMMLVTLLHYIFGWSAWPARIGAALGAWALGYWFNRKIVFK